MSQLRRSQTDRILGGVCGGIAEYLGISSLGVRILFVILPISLFAYLVLFLVIPDDSPY